MTGDFSRNTFDRRHRFSRVLMQQGRVLLDADWNEQTSILLHYLRTLATHVIGRHGSPDGGFAIGNQDANGNTLQNNFTIGRGHYYVDGILCENLPPVYCPPLNGAPDAEPLTFMDQPDYAMDETECKRILANNGNYLVYLDVWERHLTYIAADHIREVALGGPDTATRARVVWQVRVAREPDDADELDCDTLLAEVLRRDPPCLRARARVAEPSEDPCIIPPEARYRGAENQLYRVEIHTGTTRTARRPVTFKWSRDNGSVAFAIRSLQGSTARLDSLGPDDRRSLREGDWVEIIDDDSALKGGPRDLAQVTAVDRVGSAVTLDLPQGFPSFDENSLTHPLLRRWDQGSAAIPLQEETWIDLEDGVQIYFEEGRDYRSGDYWLIPARTATGDVLWPTQRNPDRSVTAWALPPDGIEHHYAPLARIAVAANGDVTVESSCRCTFSPLCVREGARREDREERPGSETRPGDRVVREPEERVERPIRNEIDRERRLAMLRRITEVGRARAELLLASGRDTPAAVAEMSVEEVRNLLSVPDETARTILESARRLAQERG